jgi:hypothetical protein
MWYLAPPRTFRNYLGGIMSREQDFAASLRWWRRRRGWSQLDLAVHAEISQRIESFFATNDDTMKILRAWAGKSDARRS